MTPVKEIQTGITSAQRNRIPRCLRPPNRAYAQFQVMLQVHRRSTAPKNSGRGTMFETSGGVSIVALQYSVGCHNLFDCRIALVQFCHACAVSFVVDLCES
jgi:hypothetical protein